MSALAARGDGTALGVGIAGTAHGASTMVGTARGALITAGILGVLPHGAVVLGEAVVPGQQAVPATGAHRPGVVATLIIMSTLRSTILMSTTSTLSMTTVVATE